MYGALHLRFSFFTGGRKESLEKVQKNHIRSKSLESQLLQILQSYINQDSFQNIMKLELQTSGAHSWCRLKYLCILDSKPSHLHHINSTQMWTGQLKREMGFKLSQLMGTRKNDHIDGSVHSWKNVKVCAQTSSIEYVSKLQFFHDFFSAIYNFYTILK
jgi:hypothetical protein